MNYYISDTHFGHANVIRLDGRPFSNPEEMATAIIDGWNARVQEADDVYLLGDVCYRSPYAASFYLSRLKGRKHLVIGNHDGLLLQDPAAVACFEDIDKMMHVTDHGHQICLCHFPLAEWNGSRHGAWHIYGHIHNNTGMVYTFMRSQPNCYNAGCMINGYQPVTLPELVINNDRFDQHVRNK